VGVRGGGVEKGIRKKGNWKKVGKRGASTYRKKQFGEKKGCTGKREVFGALGHRFERRKRGFKLQLKEKRKIWLRPKGGVRKKVGQLLYR